MAVELINATFDAFVQFAQTQEAAGKSRAVARFDADAGELGGIVNRTIKPGSGDWVGIGAGRLASLKRANNATREAFRNAVANMFGGESHIPDSVKEAMKLEDYGKGKPLTARRILAVKAAIEQLGEKRNACIKGSKADFRYTKDGRELCDKRIETAFLACDNNFDVMDIVQYHIGPITVNGADQLRTEEGVQKKVGSIVANLNELKKLSKDNPMIYEAGRKMLMDTGVTLDKGMFAKLVKACNKASIDGLRELSGSSFAMDIHNVTRQMHKFITQTMLSCGADKLGGGDANGAVRKFIATVVISRCGKSAIQHIRDAMDSEDASMLLEYYSLTGKGQNVHVRDESDAVQDGVRDAGSVCYYYLDIIDKCVNHNLDLLNPAKPHNSFIKDHEGPLDVNDIGGKPLVDDTISQAREINEQMVQNCIDDTVSGSGKGADEFRNILFETARNELARFVTGDPNATYADLKSSEDRNKVHLLMAMISQETEKAGENGIEYALSPEEDKTAFQMWHPYEGATRSFSIEKRKDGGISLHYTLDNPITDIKEESAEDTVPVGKDSRLKCQLDYTLNGTEFNRLAKLDYGKFDDKEGSKIFNRGVEMPDGSRQRPGNVLENVVETFAEEFRITADCQMTFMMNLEPSEQDLIDAQR